jgi:hypothetical protein
MELDGIGHTHIIFLTGYHDPLLRLLLGMVYGIGFTTCLFPEENSPYEYGIYKWDWAVLFLLSDIIRLPIGMNTQEVRPF